MTDHPDASREGSGAAVERSRSSTHDVAPEALTPPSVSRPVDLEEWERLAIAVLDARAKAEADVSQSAHEYVARRLILGHAASALAEACSPERILGLIGQARKAERHAEIFRWLLGESGEFPESVAGRRYSFRTELRARLRQANSAAPEERDDA